MVGLQTRNKRRICKHKPIIGQSYRIGEASNPGPTSHMSWAHSKGFDCLSIPGDGQCLYASIAFHKNSNPDEVRGRLLEYSVANPTLFSSMGFPTGLQIEAEAQLRSRQEWGGALQILIASKLWRANIAVHCMGSKPTVFWGGSPEFCTFSTYRLGETPSTTTMS